MLYNNWEEIEGQRIKRDYFFFYFLLNTRLFDAVSMSLKTV